MSLDTLAIVKLSMGITVADDDDFLTLLMDAADSFVADYCGRDFQGGNYVEYHPGGSTRVFLKNYPVQTVVSVRVDPTEAFGPETIVSASAYTTDPDSGVIESKQGPFVPSRPGFVVRATDFPRSVRVEYTTATGSVPAALRKAYAELISYWYRQTKTHGHIEHLNLLSRPLATGGFETLPFGVASGFKIPTAVQKVLDFYRVPACS